MNLWSCTWCICYLAFCLSRGSSSAQETDIFGNLYGLQVRDESLRNSSADFSAVKKINLIRYYLGPKIPGEKVAVVVDTAAPFYDNIKRLWKMVMTGGEIDADIMLFVYNDTDCSLMMTLTNENRTATEILDEISPSMSSFSVAGGILECVNLAQRMIDSDSSVMLFTGRKAGDGLALGKSIAEEMIKKRKEFNGIWSADDPGSLEEVYDYKQIASKTNGHFIQFTKIEEAEIVTGYKTRNYVESNNLSPDVGSNFPALETSRDETADLLYDPKLSPINENSAKIERENFARIVNGDDDDGRKEALEAEDMELASITAIELATRLETTAVEVTSATSLVGRPGSVSRVSFSVTNNYPVTIRHYFQGRSTSFNIVYLEPRNAWIESGKSVTVIADVLVPTTASTSTLGTVTLVIQGIGTVERSAYIYVRETGSTIYDTAKPTINYSFNNNCAGRLGSGTCSNNLWTVDVTVRDSDSGLQRVTSSPKGIQPATTFISGTKSSTKFQYAGTCCQTTVVVTAEDLLGNSISETIDVTVWYNLSEGEIAAVVLGSLLLLLILVVIVLIIIFCIRRRKKSQDLPYTQRYGSRPPAARSERTSF